MAQFTINTPSLPKPKAPQVRLPRRGAVVTVHNAIKYGALIPAATMIVSAAAATYHLALNGQQQDALAVTLALVAAAAINYTEKILVAIAPTTGTSAPATPDAPAAPSSIITPGS
jgi:hypothetical protein